MRKDVQMHSSLLNGQESHLLGMLEYLGIDSNRETSQATTPRNR